jgi:hypothetical protein
MGQFLSLPKRELARARPATSVELVFQITSLALDPLRVYASIKVASAQESLLAIFSRSTAKVQWLAWEGQTPGRIDSVSPYHVMAVGSRLMSFQLGRALGWEYFERPVKIMWIPPTGGAHDVVTIRYSTVSLIDLNSFLTKKFHVRVNLFRLLLTAKRLLTIACR